MFLKRADTHILCNEYSSKESRASNTPRLVVAESRTLRIKEGDVVNIYIYVWGTSVFFPTSSSCGATQAKLSNIAVCSMY